MYEMYIFVQHDNLMCTLYIPFSCSFVNFTTDTDRMRSCGKKKFGCDYSDVYMTSSCNDAQGCKIV